MQALDPQQKLELPTSVALTWWDSIRKESQRLSGGFGFHAPTAVSEHPQPVGEDAQAQLTRPLLVEYFVTMYLFLVVVWSKAKVWEVEQSPVSGKWSPLASLAILLEVQVHQMFPLTAENCRSSQ